MPVSSSVSRSDRQHRPLRLPQRVAAVQAVECVERADFSKTCRLVLRPLADAQREIVHAVERAGADDSAMR